MTITKSSFLAALGISCALIVGCGDEHDKRLSNQDVACLKLIQAGGSCAGAAGSVVNTTTVTATSTVTITNTTVVPK